MATTRSIVLTTKLAELSSRWAGLRVSRRVAAPSGLYTRVLHWTVALFFFLALFTGFGIYLPWLFRWFTPIFGGGPLSRIMHPYFGRGVSSSFLWTASSELARTNDLDSGRLTLDAHI